jgi:2-oxo-3-hexenedioate decarboxylase
MSHDDLSPLARQVIQAQDGCVPLSPFSSTGRRLSVHDAYEVSWLVHEHRLASGWRAVGRKIGFTNRDLWTLFGVDQPVWSFVYDRTCRDVDPQAVCELEDLFQPRIEPEIALRLRGVPRTGASEAEVLDCIEWVAHAIEMVHCHYPDWKFASTDAICDSSFHGRLLLGKRLSPRSDGITESLLKDCQVILRRDGERVEVGFGRNVLGSPLSAVASLVEAIAREGAVHPLAPGEIITTGTLTKAYPVKAGERWETRFERDAFPGLAIAFA